MPTRSCPPKAILYMFGLTLPIDVALGIAASVAGMILGPPGYELADLPAKFGNSINLIAPLFTFLTIGFYMMAFLLLPGVVVMMISSTIGWLAKKGQCRHTNLAGWAGAFNGLLIYGVHVLFSWIQFGGVRFLTSGTARQIHPLEAGGIPWLDLVWMAVELSIIVGYGAYQTSKMIARTTFKQQSS